MACAKQRRLRLLTVGRKGEGIRLVANKVDGFAQTPARRARRQRLPAAAAAGRAISRSRMRSSPPAWSIATGGEPAAVFAALAQLEGAKGRLDLVGETQRRADLRRLCPQARRARQGARCAAALRERTPGRGVRRRRRSRSGQAADDGRRSRPRRPTASSSPTTIRAARIRPRSAPRSCRRRRARSRSATAARRSAPRSPSCAPATCC